MAIYHLSVQTISRGKGKSCVAAAAYRAGEKLHDERQGINHDYTKKKEIESEIIAPLSAPSWVNDREKLWNEVDRAETRCNSRTAREINIALPLELSKEQQKQLVREYVKESFVDKGMVADVCFHFNDGNNPHCHVMLTTREINQEGFINKNRDWDKKEKVEEWREQWANHSNRALEKAGCQERIDHRSYKEQGIDQLPTIHLGKTSSEMQKKGIDNPRTEINKQIKELNKERVIALDEYRKLKEQLEQPENVHDQALLTEKKNLETLINARGMQLDEWNNHLSLKLEYEMELEKLNKSSGIFANRAEKKELKAKIVHEETCLKSMNYNEEKYGKFNSEYRYYSKKLDEINNKLNPKAEQQPKKEVSERAVVNDSIDNGMSKVAAALKSIGSNKRKDKDEAKEAVVEGMVLMATGLISLAKDAKENIKTEINLNASNKLIETSLYKDRPVEPTNEKEALKKAVDDLGNTTYHELKSQGELDFKTIRVEKLQKLKRAGIKFSAFESKTPGMANVAFLKEDARKLNRVLNPGLER